MVEILNFFLVNDQRKPYLRQVPELIYYFFQLLFGPEKNLRTNLNHLIIAAIFQPYLFLTKIGVNNFGRFYRILNLNGFF